MSPPFAILVVFIAICSLVTAITSVMTYLALSKSSSATVCNATRNVAIAVVVSFVCVLALYSVYPLVVAIMLA